MLLVASALLVGSAGCRADHAPSGPAVSPGEQYPTHFVTLTGIEAGQGAPMIRFGAVEPGWADWSADHPAAWDDDSTSLSVRVPPHPAGLAVGGTLTLTIEGSAQGPLELVVRPAPPAPGATRKYVAGLAAQLRGLLAAWDQSPDRVLTAFREDPGSLPPQLFVPALALHLIAGPEHENALVRVLDGTAPVLQGAALELDDTDRLVGLWDPAPTVAGRWTPRGLLARWRAWRSATQPVQLQASLVPRLPRLAARPPIRAPRSPSTTFPLPRSGKVDIHTATALDHWMGKRAELEQEWGGLKGTVRNDVVNGVGLVPHAGATLIGVSNTLFEWSLRSNLALLPSRLDPLVVAAAPRQFLEDDERTGTWSATVMARSESFTLSYGDFVDAVGGALEALKFAKGAAGAAGEVLRGSAGDAAASDLGAAITEYVGGQTLNASKNWHTGQKQVQGPYTWGPIDVSSQEWTTVRISSRDGEPPCVSLDSLWLYRPAAAGVCRLVVETDRDRFGGVFTWGDQLLRVETIRVTVGPDRLTVSPGSTTPFTAKVENAVDPSVTWSATGGKGEARGEQQYAWTAPPLPEGRCTELFTIEATSSTRTGARRSREPPRTGSATVTVRDPDVLAVVPGSLTLAPGERAAFTVDPPVAVQWTATGGQVEASGRYTAPAQEGDYEVAAIAKGANAGCGDRATVFVRKPQPCAWQVMNSRGRPGDQAHFARTPEGIAVMLQSGQEVVTFRLKNAPSPGRVGSVEVEGGGNIGVPPGVAYEVPATGFLVTLTENTATVLRGEGHGPVTISDSRVGPRGVTRPGTLALSFSITNQSVGGMDLQGLAPGIGYAACVIR